MRSSIKIALGSALMYVVIALNHPAFAAAQEPTTGIFGSNLAAKVIAGSIAFGMAALGAGLAVGRAGAAGLAATAEKTEVRTFALIITSLGEAIAIYGLVVAILIFGQ